MLLSLLVSTIIAAATSVAPTSSVVTADDQIWLGVACDAGTENATLEIYKSADLQQWGSPVLTVAPEGKAVIGGYLFLDAQGALQLYYTLTSGAYDGEGVIYNMSCQNPLSAPSQWSEPVKVGIGCVTAAPVIAADGSLSLPAALWGPSCIDESYKNAHPELDERRGPFTYRSVDGGKTWTEGAVMNVPERLYANYNNPRVYASADGTLNMVSRGCDSGFLYRSQSRDGGATWSLPDKFMQNPHRDFALTRLSDGRLIMVKNFKLDVRQFFCDRELYAYISEDEGESWYGGMHLTKEAFVGLPVVSQNKAGDIFVACRKHNQDTSAVMIFKTTADEIERSLPHKSLKVDAEPVVAFSAGKAKDAHLAKNAAYLEKRMQPYPHGLRLATYNIQRQGWGGGPSWADRRESVFAEFIEHKWDIVGTQEASEAYVKEIIKETGIKYAYVGNSKQFTLDRHRGGSEQFVIYRKDRFQPIKWDVMEYRLDKTKFAGANTNTDSYGADYYKATFWVKFYDKKNDMYFYHVNLHYPVRTPSARDAYSELLVEYITKNFEGLPVVITGDFNCAEDGWGCRHVDESFILDDTMYSLPPEKRINWNYSSGGGYTPIENKPTKVFYHIDHVYYTPSQIEVLTWELDIDTIHDGKYASDHHPITVDLKFYK
jgi:endonuclease/exonuclease/phosphatase family metal-dependent hydrolase